MNVHVSSTRKARVVIGLFLAVLVAWASFGLEKPPEAWPQWGGPRQDFRASSQGLSKHWPVDGPPKLWSREVGDGFSSILFEEGRLYTMARSGEKEVVLALDSRQGRTLWEFSYDSSPREGHVDEFGRGPRSTPLLAEGRLFTIGVAGRLHALNKATGELLWAKDLWAEPLSGNFLLHGYAASPISYEGSLIVVVGGENAGLGRLPSE